MGVPSCRTEANRMARNPTGRLPTVTVRTASYIASRNVCVAQGFDQRLHDVLRQLKARTSRAFAVTSVAAFVLLIAAPAALAQPPAVSVYPSPNTSSALPQTQIIEGQLGRVLSWYDNEWGFSTRMSDTAIAMSKLI